MELTDNIFKIVSTTSDKLSQLSVEFGQLIFCKDERALYFDTDERTSYQQIIILSSESLRQSMLYPVSGFYYVQDTCIIWNYDGEWHKLTNTPKDQIVFDDYENFPTEGSESVLYIDGIDMYRWLNGAYVNMMNGISWGTFS